MMNLKEVFDRDFLLAYGIPENKRQDIKQECTNASDFDLIDKEESEENFIVEFGKGTGSFENNVGYNVEILAYDNLVKNYNGKYDAFKGSKSCDFILYSEKNSTIVLNEHTSSAGGRENLEKEDRKTHMTKFQKVEKQLSDTLTKLKEVDSLNGIISNCITRICLVSYELYRATDNENKTRKAFNRVTVQIDKETGENGAKLSCWDIEEKGFEYRRISHNYKFRLS